MASITFKNVSKKYPNGFHAVTDFNLEIKDREIVVFLGPSGCGKTSMLRMLAGLEEVTGGEVYIGNTLVNEVKPKDRDIGMVFQNYALFPHMTVYENIAFGLRPKQLSAAEIRKSVEEVAEAVGVANLLERKPNGLSGGQRQRVALCRALVCRHKVVLLDEPLSNLDAALRVSMRTELLRLHQKFETTFVFVTHDQYEAMAIADKIVLMKDGAIQQVGTAEELYSNPCNTFVAGFIGTPKMNFWNGVVSEQNGEMYVACGNTQIKLPNTKPVSKSYIGKEVIVGIRPEDVRIDECDSDVLDAEVTLSIFNVRERHLHFVAEGIGFVACVAPQFMARKGDKIKVSLKTEKLHLFDVDTKKML